MHSLKSPKQFHVQDQHHRLHNFALFGQRAVPDDCKNEREKGAKEAVKARKYLAAGSQASQIVRDSARTRETWTSFGNPSGLAYDE